jgi:hypothetical protein
MPVSAGHALKKASKNKVKIIRAIEIAKALGKVPAVKSEPLYDARQIGLIAPDKVLKALGKTGNLPQGGRI